VFDLAQWLRKLWPEKCPQCGGSNTFRLRNGSENLIGSKTRELPNYMVNQARRTGFATQSTEQWQGVAECSTCGFQKPKTWVIRRID
jgi:predicted RNA-binding Zn-ribbon protein involved in translation (DUF1610 family)